MPRILGLAVLLLLAVAAQAETNTHEYKLDNGMKLIVREDHRAPVVISQVWYKIGSNYEHDGITGVSHALEHMMFKGTKAHPAGEFSRIIAENGGSENAFTGRDYTAYYQELEKSRLPVSFELEADRMRNLSLPPAEFAKEIKVVMEERRLRTEDDPQALTYEQFLATAFLSSPNRIPVIGWMDDLENLRVTDVRDWYHLWYAPNNATLVVVGDVQPEAVYALAKRYFGPLKPETLPPDKPRKEVPQVGERRIIVKVPAQLPYLIMGYKTPVLRTASEPWEAYALDVLAGILDGGESARLPTRLVRGAQVAAEVDAGYDLYDRLDNLFLLDGTPTQGHSIADLEKALRAEIQQLRDAPVTNAELERVKAQVVANAVYQRDSIFYQAMQIGQVETVGLDWHVVDEYPDRIRAVTAAQVQQVARKYLVDDGLTVAELVPLPIDPKHPPRSSAGGHGDVR
jgi:zinc protease